MNHKVKQKSIALILAITLLLGILPLHVFADDAHYEENSYEEINENNEDVTDLLDAVIEVFATTWRRPLFTQTSGDHIANRMPDSGPRNELERDMDVLVNRYGQRLFGAPNEHGAATYIADRFREAGDAWDVVHHHMDRSAHPASWPANTRTQPFSGRLAFNGDLPDIYGMPFPNTDAWNDGDAFEDVILVDLGFYPDLAIPTDVLPLLDVPNPPAVIGAIRYIAYPHVDTPGNAHNAFRHQFNINSLNLAIEDLENDNEIEIASIMLSATGRLDPAERQLVDYNIESLTPGVNSQNHGMVAPQLQNANNTSHPMIAMPLHFMEQALDRADELQSVGRYHRRYDNTVIATRPAPNGDPDLIIVMTSHIDSVLPSQGAADNASSTAAMLEIARRFADVDLGNIELRLAAVGAHEGGGMTGSRLIIDGLTPEQRAVTININMDIIASLTPSLVDGRPVNAISMDIFNTPAMPFGFNLPAHLVVSVAEEVWTPGQSGIDNVRIFNFGGSEHTNYTQAGIDAASMIMVDDAENDLELAYHNARDNMEENYCYDRLRLSTDLMINAIQHAIEREVTKRATFYVDATNDVIVLGNATQLYQTFDQVDAELVADVAGTTVTIPLVFEYPATSIDLSNELDGHTYEEVTIQNVLATGTSIADHANTTRNEALNTFTSRTVARVLPLPTFTLELGRLPQTGSATDPTREGSGNLATGEETVITAGVPSSGYRFVRFNVTGGTLSDLDTVARTVTFTMGTENAVVMAVYERNENITPPTPTPPRVAANPTVNMRRTGIIRNNTVALRRGPGAAYQFTRNLSRGQQVTILNLGRANWRFVQVGSGNVRGWVQMSQITETTTFGIVTGDRVPLRAGANSGAQLTRLRRNASLTILGTNASGNWTQVRAGSRTGWVQTRQIRTITQPRRTRRRIALRQGPGSNFGTIRTLSNRASIQVLGRQGNWVQVRAGNRTGWVQRNATQVTPQLRARRQVQLRQGPGNSFSRVSRGSVSRNTRVRVLARQGSWSRIRVGNRTGWVRTNQLR